MKTEEEKGKDMTTTNSKEFDEVRIRGIMEDRVKAVRDKDLSQLLVNYASEVLSFDAINQLQLIGSDAIRKRAEEWFSLYKGEIGCEIRELTVTTGDDAAFCHSLNRISGTTTDGKQVDMWVRSTVCFCKINGKWLVIHEHTSVPFDVESGKVLLDLKP